MLNLYGRQKRGKARTMTTGSPMSFESRRHSSLCSRDTLTVRREYLPIHILNSTSLLRLLSLLPPLKTFRQLPRTHQSLQPIKPERNLPHVNRWWSRFWRGSPVECGYEAISPCKARRRGWASFHISSPSECLPCHEVIPTTKLKQGDSSKYAPEA